MELNDIKKFLYREKPTATFMYIRKGAAYYSAWINGMHEVIFEIPVNDMGDADFLPEMDAKLLARYIQK